MNVIAHDAGALLPVNGQAQLQDEPEPQPVTGHDYSARYLNLLAWITDYIYTVTIANGRPVKTLHSLACLAVTGYTVEEYEANPALWYEMIHPADRAAVTSQVAAALAGRTPVPVEHRIIRKDGSIHWLRNAIVIQKDADGQVIGYDGVINDVTELKRLEMEIQEISDRERIRIGQDLHDGLGQRLVALTFYCVALEKRLKTVAPMEAKTVTKMLEVLDDTVAQAHRLAHVLYPVELETEGLTIALVELAQQVSDTGPLACKVDCPVPVRLTDHTVATHLYRIVQEAVDNAVKHAQAKSIWIRLRPDTDQLLIQVEDDGIGLPANGLPTQGMGVNIMHYRAHNLGATVDFSHGPAGGTLVTCRYPLPPPIESPP